MPFPNNSMNNIETTTYAFNTHLTAKQLNLAIRVGALLHTGEHRFEGHPGIDGWLKIHSTVLTRPLKATCHGRSVTFEFAALDRSMFESIRTILDDTLLFDPTSGIQAEGCKKPHLIERMSA